MAKKKQELTSEELLAEALVREEDWPYRVPGNWVWVRLGGLIQEIKNGTTVKQNKLGLGAKVTRIETIQNNNFDLGRLGYIEDLNTIKDTDWYCDGDIALSHINSAAHVGKTAMISNDLLPLVHGMNLLRIRFNQACNPQYFQYFSQTFQYKGSIIQRINMAVNQVSINQKQLANVEFPLPPLAEQQRIVNRIESLFDKLDQAKDLIQEALDSFENRKAAILHQAFTGELTKKWREEHGVVLESWEEVPFNKFCLLKRGYDLPSKERTAGEYPLVSSSGIIDSHFEYKAKGPGIVTGRSGTLGKVYYVEDNYWPLNTTLYSKEIFDNYPRYIYHYLCQFDFKKYSSSTAVPTLNRNNFSEIAILKPKYEEQQEIVRLLDDLFAKEQAAKDLCDLIAQIEAIKKTILGKAFRGELGTNEDGEESSVSLLKEIFKSESKI